jgi:hypothetical protein
MRWSAARGEGVMAKLFQIFEDDLAELERILPQLADALTPILAQPEGSNRLRAQIRRCKAIISNVRWDYQPHEEIEIIPADED